MKITVILCTYNRCKSLERALESAARLQLPSSVEWDLLVVDNNSKDQTPEVVDQFSKQYPGRFAYLFEPQPGKSYALNAGIRHATGEILAFMDDDVSVDPEWLQNLTSGLQDESWVGAGGRVAPDWTESPPSWLPYDGRGTFGPLAAFDPGIPAGPLIEAPFGTNMAFRKWAFEKHGSFRTDLGPCPGSEIRSEDTEFGRRLLAAGEKIRYEPSALVFHPVAPERLRKQYFLDWWFDKARADIREMGFPVPTRWLVAGIPIYMFRHLCVWTVRWLIALDSKKRFAAKINIWGRLGEILECYRIYKRTGRSATASPAH